MRTSKTVNGATTEYVYNGDILVAEYAPTYICVYIYDESGAIIGAKYIATTEGSTWQKYFFEKNLQGDVVAVYSDTGTKLISYRYDAWGNTTTTYHNGGASTLASKNRITYRSYYYDTDLGMYYLQSRYYDAKICRFINADAYVSTGQGFFGNNMFAYCENNPVMRIDPTGEFWFFDDIDYDEVSLEGAGAGCGGGYYYGYGTSYYNYAVYSRTASYDSFYGGYYYSGLSSAIMNPTYFFVPGSVSVVDYMNTSSRGSSAKILPANLTEKLALESVKSNPRGVVISGLTLNDPKWSSRNGWVKMQQTVFTSKGNISIHYLYNDSLHMYDDFKIVGVKIVK